MPPRRKTKRVVVKRGGSIKSTVDKALKQVKKTYVSKIKPIGKKIFKLAKQPKISNMMLTKEDFERMERRRNTDPNARRKYRRKQLNYAQILGQPLPRRGGNVALAKWGISMIPEVYKLAASGVGSQGGRSAGSRAAYTRYGPPLLSRYR